MKQAAAAVTATSMERVETIMEVKKNYVPIFLFSVRQLSSGCSMGFKRDKEKVIFLFLFFKMREIQALIILHLCPSALWSAVCVVID